VCSNKKTVRKRTMKKILILAMCAIAANMNFLAADEAAQTTNEVADCCHPKCCKPSCHKECHCHKPCEKPCHKPCEKPCPKPCEKPCQKPCEERNMEQERASRSSFENSLSSSQRRQYNNFSDSQKQRAMDMSRDNNMSPNQAVDKVAAGN